MTLESKISVFYDNYTKNMEESKKNNIHYINSIAHLDKYNDILNEP